MENRGEGLMLGTGLWQGAAILTLANFLNKVLSFVYRILVIRLIGPESMGLYEMVFPFYTFVLVVATAGLPLALAKIVAERAARGEWGLVRNVFHLSLFFLVFSGLVFTAILYFGAPLLGRLFADERVYPVFMVMMLALPLVCTCSAFRGYFQGLKLMGPLALAQVIEQVTRVSSGLGLALHLLPRGIEWGAAGLAWGMVLGEAVGLIISLLIFRQASPYYLAGEGQPIVLKDFLTLARLAVPATLARAATGLTLTLEAILIPHRLQLWGASLREATALYGQYSGIALTLVYLPMTITVAIAMAMVPGMAEAQALENYSLLQRRSFQALKVTVLSGLPFAMFFLFLATEISDIIFKAPEAGAPLKILAWGCLFLYLQQTTSGILQGLGAMKINLYTTLVDGAADLVVIYFLTPLWGIKGAAWGINLGAFLSTSLNLLAICRLIHLRFNFLDLFGRPCLAALVMGVSIKLLQRSAWSIGWRELVGLLLIASITYIVALLLTRTISLRSLALWKRI
ncbi:MAG: polysaccharide biosynthesis protein [Thermanaeromonas sp.]|uniref:putative polysaccharide biosynthesis protein n=1 Tax=Thermanaeromonas sp. TaxID=2003697 RepID=UPI00243B9B4B|nr:polysaccharide biosynthesis protein [Thermanaeromonas sp.]MCG0277324.1 polysaccharide biosynthesis protein [Thermanaeromonas sp.]